MKLSKIACTVALCVSASTMAADNMTQTPTHVAASTTANVIDPITWSTVGGWIISGAESAIKNGVKSFLKNALFGSGGPDYVMLHADALQQIEDIVTEVVLNSDVENAKSVLMSFQGMLEYYNATAQDDNPDLTILPILINYATSLQNHQAYRDSYNPNAHLLTGSYSLVAALTIAVFTEKELQGAISHAYVKSVADTLYASLTSLGAKANTYISSNVYVRNPVGDCSGVIIYAQGDNENGYADTQIDVPQYSDVQVNADAFLSGPGFAVTQDSGFRSDCNYYVYDNVAGTSKRYAIALYGQNLASRLAYNQKNALVASYKDKIKGNDYDVIASGLAAY
jgi:hypothetical protein